MLAELVLPHTLPLLDAGIELHCQIGLPGEVLTKLLSDQLDIAVLTKVEGAPIKQLYLLPWQNEEFVLVGPAGCAPYDPAGEKQRFIGYAESMPMARRYFRACWGDSPPSPTLTVPDMRAVVRAVQAGTGYAVVPMYLAASGLAQGTLDVAHTAESPVVNPLYLAMRRGREHLPRVRAVFTHLTSSPL
ncbi:substrate-binding domain-containing protein [Amycolatopsis sp. NPDC059657]|uniref:substrate-binding domain-containing protein n=1 Tax=Amycolatopsis sp. NPDC059657 TaxID=3346899 RepID=UPI0036726C96